jgi:cytochrome bd-type quinol oxidase subunit 1
VVNITSSIEDIKAGRAKLKHAQKVEKVKGKAAKKAKRDAELPLLSLFHDEELLEEGNDKITLPVLLSFVAKHSLAKYVKQAAGRGSTMSKINLMIFVTELCSQVQ